MFSVSVVVIGQDRAKKLRESFQNRRAVFVIEVTELLILAAVTAFVAVASREEQTCRE